MYFINWQNWQIRWQFLLNFYPQNTACKTLVANIKYFDAFGLWIITLLWCGYMAGLNCWLNTHFTLMLLLLDMELWSWTRATTSCVSRKWVGCIFLESCMNIIHPRQVIHRCKIVCWLFQSWFNDFFFLILGSC